MTETIDAYEGWAILELMGHRRLGGYVKQVEQYGTAMVRIDVPGAEGQEPATQFYSGSSLYCVTPTTEEIARGLAERIRPTPVNLWDLPRRPALPEPDMSDVPECAGCGELVDDCTCQEADTYDNETCANCGKYAGDCRCEDEDGNTGPF